ncbi:hypothetical protein GCM10022291_31170 [Postechiella marina]|uniref:HTH araC/xylS-type domain-containing protein n=1 Tax=Postechiella marina TaxID=943941 RepID=A0ABP8CG99_9FLAO
MDYNILDIISILSLFIGLFFGVFLFSKHNKNKLSNKIFGAFLILCATDNIFLSKLLHTNFEGLSRFIAFGVFLQLPVFYLYVLSVCYSDFKLKPKHLLHAIPFVIVNILMASTIFGINPDSKVLLLSGLTNDFKNAFIHVFVHIQVVSYLVAVFVVLRRAKKIYLENYANASIAFYTWLFQLTIVISILHSFAILKNIYKFSDYDTFYYWTRILLVLTELIIFCWYVLKALNTPELFKSVDSKLKLASNLVLNDAVTKENKAVNTDVEALQHYMTTKEPFLDSSLTMQDLANQINSNPRDTSVLINHTIGKHFFDFVNEYRIEKAMRILENPAKNKQTVLEILYEVGFNSKSSFNTAFKKHTGSTPTAYRKSNQNQVA